MLTICQCNWLSGRFAEVINAIKLLLKINISMMNSPFVCKRYVCDLYFCCLLHSNGGENANA